MHLDYLEIDDETDIPWNYELENYYFVGWYTQENGKGNPVTQNTILYDDMVVYPFFIEKVSEDAVFYVKPLGSYTYTGASIKPNITVYAGDTLLTKGVHYTVSYKNNKLVADGDAAKAPTITIKGKGTFAEYSKTVTFSIVPKNIYELSITARDMVVCEEEKD